MKINNLLSLLIILTLIFLIPTGEKVFAQNNNKAQIDSVKELLIDENYDESIKLLNNILKEDSSDVDAYFYLGICFRAVSDFPKSADVLSKALKYKPGDLKIMISLGNDLIASGRFSEAKEVLSRALLQDSVNSSILNSLGNVLMQKHEWNQGLKIYNNLIKNDSTKSCYYVQAAKCSAILEDTSSAIVDYQIALKLNPQNEQTIINLSRLYYLKKKFISAARIIDNGLAVYPYSPEMWLMKGKILAGMKDYKNAINSYSNSVAYGDSSLMNFRDLGMCYYYTGMFDTAIVCLESAVKIEDNDPASYFYLGTSYKGLKKYELAIENLTVAAGLLKNDILAEIYTQLGSSYYSNKEYRKALDAYRDAYKEKPDKFEINFYLAVVYDHYYKDKTVAMNYYKKFLMDSSKTDLKLVNYAADRLDYLIEDNFMNSGE